MASERSSTRSSVNTPRVSADTRPTQQQRTLRGQRMATAILFIFMLCAAALGAYYTFVMGVRTENDLFSKQWQSAVTNLVTTFNAKLAAKVAAGQLAASYFTFSAGPSAVFPFVSYPAWNVLAWSMNATANVRAMAWLPLVLSSQVDAFWAFANATVGVQWANATAAMLGYGTEADFEAGVALVRAAVAAGPYGLPSAVRVPINASDPLHFIVLQEGLLAGNERAILYDALSEPIHAAAAMEAYTSQNASISDFLVLAQDVATGTNRFASVVYTPVFQGASVVGLSNSYWMWDTVVESALPTFFTGIVVVVTSTSTGKSITMVGGPNGFSSFEGDASGSKSVVPSSAVRFVSSASVGNTSFAIVVYPTTALLASYETDDPRNHAIEVVAVVAACILLFALQNWLVRSHSVGVSRTLDATSRLLDDVFPKGVRARVVESMARRSRLQQAQALADTLRGGGRRASVDTAAEKDEEVLVEAGLVPASAGGGSASGASPPPRSGALLAIQKFVGLEARIAEPARASVASSLLGRGVADAFPCVSVVFSDVVGFTSWSSTVAPEAVFAYLCALFGAFDKMGARHGAYKNMAVCGLPEPDARHAERAADFALSLVTAAADVGRATGVRLALRVGVHSGPVLAGVLLGERARFQLFGDTVNVASRMESTGAPGRVQISSATAELLSASCPGSFECTPRGAVDVKGKGCLDTSWLVRRSDGTRPLPVPRLSSHHFAPTPARPHQPPHPPALFSPLTGPSPPTSSTATATSTAACSFSSSLPPLAPAGGSSSSSFASGSGSGSGGGGGGGTLPASPPWWRPRASSLSATGGGGGSGATHPSTPPQPPLPPAVRRSVDSARPAAAARLFHGNGGNGGGGNSGGGGFFGGGAFWFPSTPPRLRSASLDSSTETGGGHAFGPSSALSGLPAAAAAAAASAAAACGADAPADNADDGFCDGEEEEEEEEGAAGAEAAGGVCSRGPACRDACEGARGEAAAADVHPWCGSPV